MLVAAHHGSRTSSSVEFVEASSPLYAVFSAGYRNRFGHPHEEIVARFRDRGTRLLRTDEGGAIEIAIDPGGVTAYEYRKRERRYWQGA